MKHLGYSFKVYAHVHASDRPSQMMTMPLLSRSCHRPAAILFLLTVLLWMGMPGLADARGPKDQDVIPPPPPFKLIGGAPTIGVTPDAIAANMIPVPGKRFKVSKYEVTRAQFEEFVKATNYQAGPCRIWDGTTLTENPAGSWANPGFPQSNDDPAVCLNWADAEAYIKWLNTNAKPPRPYRFPKEKEWIAAATGGNPGAFTWGTDVLEKGKCNCIESLCADGNPFTSPGGKFPANSIGALDMTGNVWEWTTGCYLGDCGRRLILGGSWISNVQDQMRVDHYWGNNILMRTANIGLRLFQDQ